MKMATKWSGALALAALISVPLQAAEPVKVGSKIDTEGALLGNMIQQVLESHGVKTINKIQLGTTPVVRGAIVAGELDIYPDSGYIVIVLTNQDPPYGNRVAEFIGHRLAPAGQSNR